MAEHLEYVLSIRGGSASAAEVRKVEEAVKGTGGSMRQLGKDAEGSKRGLGSAAGGIRSVGKALIAAGAGFVAWEAGKKAFEFTHELVVSTKQLSSAFGLSTQEASRWGATTAAVGGNAGQSAMAFQKVASAAEKQTLATHKQIAAHKLHNTSVILGKEPLERLGISTAYLEKHQKNLGPVMEHVIDKIHGISNAQVKGSVLTNLFGRGWKQLSPILLEGGEHLKHLLGLAKLYGVEITSTQGLEDFREKQIEANFAVEGMRVAFTKLAAKPMAEMLKGFSDLALALHTGDWRAFDAQALRMGEVFSKVAEKVLPHVAETFGHMAPIVLKAFWKGFQHASLGGEAVIGAVILHKLGLTSALFSGAGKRLGASLAGGMVADKAVMAEAGTTLGLTFNAAFGAVALGAGLGLLLNKLFPNGFTGKNISTSEANTQILTGKSHLGRGVYAGPRGEILPSRGFAHTKLGGTAAPETAGGKAFRQHIIERNHRIESERSPHAHGATGGTIARAGMVEVGEHGPEMAYMPEGARIDPHGSGWGSGDIVVRVGSRELARVQKRQAMEDAAAGAG